MDEESFQNVQKCQNTCGFALLKKMKSYECMVKSIEDSVKDTPLAGQFDEYKEALYKHLDKMKSCIGDQEGWEHSM